MLIEYKEEVYDSGMIHFVHNKDTQYNILDLDVSDDSDEEKIVGDDNGQILGMN